MVRKPASHRKLYSFCTNKETVSTYILTTKSYFVIESNRVFFYFTDWVNAVRCTEGLKLSEWCKCFCSLEA